MLFENHEKSPVFSLTIHEILYAANSMQRWHDDHYLKKFKGGLGILPDLNPIGNFWSQMRKLQQQERTTSISGLKKKCMESLEISQTTLPQKALPVDAEVPKQMEAFIRAQHGYT